MTTVLTQLQPNTPSLKLTAEENLQLLPRKDGIPDTVEVVYDPPLIPILVALISTQKLRAAFILETPEQKSIRNIFTKSVNEPGFWNIMAKLGYHKNYEDILLNDSVYPVDLTAKELRLCLPFTKADIESRIPRLIAQTVASQAGT